MENSPWFTRFCTSQVVQDFWTINSILFLYSSPGLLCDATTDADRLYSKTWMTMLWSFRILGFHGSCFTNFRIFPSNRIYGGRQVCFFGMPPKVFVVSISRKPTWMTWWQQPNHKQRTNWFSVDLHVESSDQWRVVGLQPHLSTENWRVYDIYCIYSYIYIICIYMCYNLLAHHLLSFCDPNGLVSFVGVVLAGALSSNWFSS